MTGYTSVRPSVLRAAAIMGMLAALGLLSVALSACKNPLVAGARALQAEAASPSFSLSRSQVPVKASDTIDYGAVSVSTAKDIALSVVNSGKTALVIDSAKIVLTMLDETETGAFTLESTPPASLEAGGSSSFSIRFAPASTGPKRALVAIATNDVERPSFSFYVSGTGVANAKDISSFAIVRPAAAGAISGTDIYLTLPYDTDLSKLVATFQTSGVSVSVGTSTQISGYTQNDFRTPVTFVVKAADGSTKNYIVTAACAKNPSAALTAFGFADPLSQGTISGLDIRVSIPYGASKKSLVAVFSASPGASVRVGSILQESGITATNDFSVPVVYDVSSEDGSTTRSYTVRALYSGKDITAFSLSGTASGSTSVSATATISGNAISATMPYDTDLKNLVAAFTTTGNGVRIGQTAQLSGWGTNDFRSAKTYTVVAEDGSTKDYTVSVAAASSDTNDISYFALTSLADSITRTGSIAGTSITVDWPFTSKDRIGALIANFAHSGASVSVNGATQSSGVTSNSYIGPVSYIVMAANGTPKTYTVTVTIQDTAPSIAANFPTVSTTGLTTATASGASVASDGGAPITELGYCWGTADGPTIAGSHQVAGGTAVGSIPDAALTGLASGTLYYVRAYATNAVGTGYGPQKSFWAPLATPEAPTASPVGYPAGSGKIELSWPAVNGASIYDVYCSSTPTRPSSPNGPSTASTSCTVSGLTNFSAYNFWIVARNLSPTPSAPSAPGTGTPGIPVASVALDQSTLTLSSIVGSSSNTSAQLNATVLPANATLPAVTWSSSAPLVASVASGLVTGLGTGVASATITATANGQSATCAVAVAPVQSVSLNASAAPLRPSATFQAIATIEPANAPNKGLTWSSSDSGVASVSSTGLITAGGKMGTATVTVATADGAKAASMSVAVYPTDMVAIAGGTFRRDAASASNLSMVSPFLLGKYDVTQAQYLAVMGANPSRCAGDLLRPVETVSWYAALAFCNKLSMSEGLVPVYAISGSKDPSAWGPIPTTTDAAWDAAIADLNASGYRLPTEMEWMWAAMGGMSDARSGDLYMGKNIGGYTKYYAGSQASGYSDAINDYAWNGDNVSDNSTQRIGTMRPNEFDLYDMSGNVWQWCWDFSSSKTEYSPIGISGGVSDYTGPGTGTFRAIHGGSYLCSASSSPNDFRLSYGRRTWPPAEAGNDLGFRVARSNGGSYAPRSGLVGEYLLNGSVNDTSNRGHNGTIISANPIANRKGETASAYYLPYSSSSNIDLGAVSDFQFGKSQAFSYSIWFSSATTYAGGYPTLLIQRNLQYQFGTAIMLGAGSGSVTVQLNENGRPPAVITAPISQNAWYHLVAAYSPNSITLYLNGSLIGSQAYTPIYNYPPTLSLQLGGHLNETPDFLGSVDDLRIYDRALSASEVQALYHEGGYGF